MKPALYPPLTRRNKVILLGLASLLLRGCGGGSETGDSNIGFSAQQPDPVVIDYPIAYIRRSLTLADSGDLPDENLLDPTAFNPGAALLLRERASPSAIEYNLSGALFPENAGYDVKDLTSSADGDLLAFALRAPVIEGAEPDEQPTWNIWTYSLTQDLLLRVIASDTIARAGNDTDPAFLPDGRLVFTSDRQTRSRAILLDDGKPQYAALVENSRVKASVLHVMDADGTNIKQISFNQSHDLNPTVLEDGSIIFQRWDRAGGRDKLSLYRINPDGDALQLVYGYHSQAVAMDGSPMGYWHLRPLPDDTLLVSQRARRGNDYGGDLLSIDIQAFTDSTQPIASATGTSVAQRSLSLLPISTDAGPSLHGRFNAADPLFDGTDRLLTSWSQCRLQAIDDPTTLQPCTSELLSDPNYAEAPPLYGLWLYTPGTGTQLPVAAPIEGEMITEVAVLAPRPLPRYVPDTQALDEASQQLIDNNLGQVHIRSVYDLGGVDTSEQGIRALADPNQTTAAERPARFLRLVKAVSLPGEEIRDFSSSAFGVSRNQLMREIIGYVPIEPDGSVAFEVPADVAFAVSIVDMNGKRLGPRHNNWLHVSAGGNLSCNGCHSPDSQVAHGRPDAEPPSINAGALTSGAAFPNTPADLIAEMGESMAQTHARLRGLRRPGVDLYYDDPWRETPVISPANRYADLQTSAPASNSCQAAWQGQCRIVIHYPDHIAPLWRLPRTGADGSDQTCINCHSLSDAMGSARVPAGQLDLSDTPSDLNPQQQTSYRELLSNDEALALDPTGALVTETVVVTDSNGNPLFQLDADGQPLLDSDNNPRVLLTTVTVPRTMSSSGATASQAFFTRFNRGGQHDGWLSRVELRLIAEWLDIGAQYYNNPFAAPVN